MKKRGKGGYDPEVELAKGAKLTASSYDKTQKIEVKAGKVTVGGKPGVFEISGAATGAQDASIAGSLNIWLSIFRYMRPDGSIDHVGGWNLFVRLKTGQSPLESAKAFVEQIKSAATRPYKAEASGSGAKAQVSIVFTKKRKKGG